MYILLLKYCAILLSCIKSTALHVHTTQVQLLGPHRYVPSTPTKKNMLVNHTCPQVDPQFYAFRWITLCLAQEFAFPDTLRIWDTLLSDPHGRMDCLLRICTSMIMLARERLLKVRALSGFSCDLSTMLPKGLDHACRFCTIVTALD